MACLIRRGVLHLDGAPQMLAATDYPYYRDERSNWEDRLTAQAEAGLDVLTCYVPWRHHAPRDPLRSDGAYDFTGKTKPTRDLVGLLDLAESLDLNVILKPGPFVHAELPFGGLPDYVCMECNPEASIEPEVDARGSPLRWKLRRMAPADVRVLPAPFGERYGQYVRDWLLTLAREVVAERAWPRGPIIATQLMNEGIYSESSRAQPTQFSFSRSTLARYHIFLEDKYGDISEYNEAHGTAWPTFGYVDPPRRPELLDDARDLLAYLDWSEFQGGLYVLAAREYRKHLVDGGVPRHLPVLFNFNPNGETYRDEPAANDGWYTRVNVGDEEDFSYGLTNWLGVVANDELAFRQYVMATTAFRGPALEQNWGFSSQYFAPYEFVTPSAFETMLALACGATGVTAYTIAGTRAWRDDPNLSGAWVPARTNDREDATSGDYPGDAPILSDGTRTPKLWTLSQIAQWLRDEGPRFAVQGPRSQVAWGIYPPYAWAGQWLPRGDPDDLLWRPPLKAVPRGAFHGLDAFVEMMVYHGMGFRQIDVSRDANGLAGTRVLCMSAHEYMDAATQARLTDFVERGGRLLLTNVVPDKDLRMRPLVGAIRARMLPHEELGRVDIHEPRPLIMDGERVGLALEYASVLRPPPDAEDLVRMEDHVVGYSRPVGAGRVAYLGVGPWRARWSGDDRLIAHENQAMTWRLVSKLLDDEHACARPASEGGDVLVVEHADGGTVFVVVREAAGETRALLAGGAPLDIRGVSQAVHAVGIENGRLASAYLKGINDARNQRVAPRASAGGATIETDAPCDVCVTRAPEGWRVSVAHADGPVRVRVPFRVAHAVDARGRKVDVEPDGDGSRILARDVRDAGVLLVAPQRGPHQRAR